MEKDKVIGFCYATLNHDIFEQQKPMALLWSLCVLPEYRKKGIGKKLVEHIEKFCKKKESEVVLLFCENNNLIAKKFYKNIGY